MHPVTVTQTGPGISAIVVPDYLIAPFQLSLAAKVIGTVSFGVEHTYDDPFALGFATNAAWFPLAAMATKTANAEGSYTSPVRAIRINQASGTGSTTLIVIQAGTGL
jgi:hypothetical protein